LSISCGCGVSYERSLRELSRLDDRELADIGLTRPEVPAAAWRAAEAAA
jgi:uncharacterized protein YjiS (DUF1127 family)